MLSFTKRRNSNEELVVNPTNPNLSTYSVRFESPGLEELNALQDASQVIEINTIGARLSDISSYYMGMAQHYKSWSYVFKFVSFVIQLALVIDGNQKTCDPNGCISITAINTLFLLIRIAIACMFFKKFVTRPIFVITQKIIFDELELRPFITWTLGNTTYKVYFRPDLSNFEKQRFGEKWVDEVELCEEYNRAHPYNQMKFEPVKLDEYLKKAHEDNLKVKDELFAKNDEIRDMNHKGNEKRLADYKINFEESISNANAFYQRRFYAEVFMYGISLVMALLSFSINATCPGDKCAYFALPSCVIEPVAQSFIMTKYQSGDKVTAGSEFNLVSTYEPVVTSEIIGPAKSSNSLIARLQPKSNPVLVTTEHNREVQMAGMI
jgi:hypothetical protein